MATSDISSSSFSRKCRPRRGGNFKHGLSDSRLESIFEKMRDRCLNPNSMNYPRYGGAGITICEAWLNDSSVFYAWALANGYQDDLQIDRRENHLGYFPSNCRWVTHQQNQNNRTDNRRLEHDGQNLTLAEWATKTGIKRNTIFMRLDKGWSVAEALTTPVAAHRRRLT